MKFADYLSSVRFTDKYIGHYLPDNAQLSSIQLEQDHEVSILIGPEGDFTDDEVKTAIARGYQTVNLGNSRLRTETAGIVALTLLNNK
jgi:16S rRNA (uracil1498-N3)-methyltransferase